MAHFVIWKSSVGKFHMNVPRRIRHDDTKLPKNCHVKESEITVNPLWRMKDCHRLGYFNNPWWCRCYCYYFSIVRVNFIMHIPGRWFMGPNYKQPKVTLLQVRLYLQLSMWKQVLRNEQSPRLSSVWLWMIFRKWSFSHGLLLEVTLRQSLFVPCGQNSLESKIFTKLWESLYKGRTMSMNIPDACAPLSSKFFCKSFLFRSRPTKELQDFLSYSFVFSFTARCHWK